MNEQRTAAADPASPAGGLPAEDRSAMARYLDAVAGRTAVAELGPAADAAHAPSQPPARWAGTSIRDVMTSNVIVVDERASFKQIVAALTTNRVSAVPVVDRVGRVVGVVSESDLLAKVAAGGEPNARMGGWYPERRQLRRKAHGETAGDVMSAPAVTVSPAAAVVEGARIAARAHVRRLPVVDDQGLLVGIVTRSDLLRVFLGGDAEIGDYVTEEILGRRYLLHPGAVVVDVTDGVVTLRGRLETKLMLEPLLEDIRGVAGVVAVHNELSYDAEYPSPPPRYPFS